MLAVMPEQQHDALGKEILKKTDSSLFEGILALLIDIIPILIHLNLSKETPDTKTQ